MRDFEVLWCSDDERVGGWERDAIGRRGEET